jgi:hypothetical protein
MVLLPLSIIGKLVRGWLPAAPAAPSHNSPEGK